MATSVGEVAGWRATKNGRDQRLVVVRCLLLSLSGKSIVLAWMEGRSTRPRLPRVLLACCKVLLKHPQAQTDDAMGKLKRPVLPNNAPPVSILSPRRARSIYSIK